MLKYILVQFSRHYYNKLEYSYKYLVFTMYTDFSQYHQQSSKKSLRVYSVNMNQSYYEKQTSCDELVNKSIASQKQLPATLNEKQMKQYEPGSQNSQYLEILYRAMRYVRKQNQRNFIDDGILAEELSVHITISTNPTYLSTVGELLLKNGYVLIAYALLIGRLHNSQLCFEYMANLFESTFEVQTHNEQFGYYKQRKPTSFGIPNIATRCKRENAKESLKRQTIPQYLGK